MSLSTLIRVLSIASFLVVPVSCSVAMGMAGSKASDGGRVTLKPTRQTALIDTNFETLGGLHKVERVEAWFVHEDGTRVPLAVSSPSSKDWGPVITTEILTKYGIPLTDGQKNAEIVVAYEHGDPPPAAGAEGELQIRGLVRLPYVPIGAKNEFTEKIQAFEHSKLVRVGGQGVPPTQTERVESRMGVIALGSVGLFVSLAILNMYWPRHPGDPRTKEQLIAMGIQGDALPKGVAI